MSATEISHGTEHAYVRYGCRCDDCKRASAEARARRRAGTGPGKTPKGQTVHSLHAYDYHGCRCSACRAAKAAAQRRWYARRRLALP